MFREARMLLFCSDRNRVQIGVGARRTGNGNALVGDQNPAAVDCVDGIELDFHLSLRCIEESIFSVEFPFTVPVAVSVEAVLTEAEELLLVPTVVTACR